MRVQIFPEDVCRSGVLRRLVTRPVEAITLMTRPLDVSQCGFSFEYPTLQVKTAVFPRKSSAADGDRCLRQRVVQSLTVRYASAVIFPARSSATSFVPTTTDRYEFTPASFEIPPERQKNNLKNPDHILSEYRNGFRRQNTLPHDDGPSGSRWPVELFTYISCAFEVYVATKRYAMCCETRP